MKTNETLLLQDAFNGMRGCELDNPLTAALSVYGVTLGRAIEILADAQAMHRLTESTATYCDSF